MFFWLSPYLNFSNIFSSQIEVTPVYIGVQSLYVHVWNTAQGSVTQVLATLEVARGTSVHVQALYIPLHFIYVPYLSKIFILFKSITKYSEPTSRLGG
jgi:hypothetical protein